MSHQSVTGCIEPGKGVLMRAEQQKPGGQYGERQKHMGNRGVVAESLA
jgi:hypothetical protein